MGCCGETKGEKQLASIKQSRCCTDVPFLLLYVLAWGALVLLFSEAQAAGSSPDKIIRGVDMFGRICGVDKGVENMSLAAWPHALHYSAKICVDSCNYTSDPSSTRMSQLYVSENYMDLYCVPSLNQGGNESGVSVQVEFGSSFSSGAEIASRAIGDIYISQSYIMGCALSCVVIVFIWIFLLKCLAGYIIFVCNIAIVLVLGYTGFAVFSWASSAEAGLDPDRTLAAKIAGGVIMGIGALWLVVIFFLRKQIKIATEVVKEASRALMDMKALLFFPVVPAGVGVLYFSLWVLIGLNIWSVTYLVPQDTPEQVMNYDPVFFPLQVLIDPRNDNPATMMRADRSDDWRNASFYHLFHMLWTVQFLLYFGYLVFAGATADWYFTSARDENGCKVRGTGEGELTKWPLLQSLKRTTLWHLGTIALCSLIIAIVQMMRVMVKYVEKQTQGSPPNKFQKALFAAIQCCLKCLECCLDKLNRNALIWTAIWGDGFCTAACSAFALLWRNLHRVAAISVVSSILINISKFVICALNAGVMWGMVMFSPMVDKVSSPMAPSAVVFAMSWLIASCFMSVFSSIIDAVFLCFLVDLETNKHGEMVASKTLQQLVDKYSSDSEKKANADKEAASRRGQTTQVNAVDADSCEPAEGKDKDKGAKEINSPKVGGWT